MDMSRSLQFSFLLFTESQVAESQTVDKSLYCVGKETEVKGKLG